MANMLPPDHQQFKTTGEEAFYRFLESVAQPNARNTAWYTPHVQGAEPDFILFSEDLGLIVFEVKDWQLNQIIHATHHYFTLDIGGQIEQRENPFRQAQSYFYKIIDLIKKDGQLVSLDPFHHGNAKIPVTCAVVFPHIGKYKFIHHNLNKVIPTERIFFWDDLNSQSPICEDPSGDCFRTAAKQMFQKRFHFQITPQEFAHLRQLIHPAVRIEVPDRCPAEQRVYESKRLKVLDQNQESIARQFEGGHRIFVGPPGSGKTLVLIHRAAMLQQYNPNVKNVLFVCYNITLVNYIKRLLADKRVPLGEGGVEVLHFFELCARITRSKIHYESEESDYYEKVIRETTEQLTNCSLKYDAILVDEGQDFSDEMMRIVVSLLNNETNHLAIALDAGQNIYLKRQSWEKVGVQARGRVHQLKRIYRNTKEIADFARSIGGGEDGSEGEEGASQLPLAIETFEFEHGPAPVISQFDNFEGIAAFVAEKIEELNSQEGYPLSEIAILYTMRSSADMPDMNVPRFLARELDRRGILYTWASEDYRAKRSYDVTTDRVTISTVHSAKGFDWACVFTVGLDWLENSGRWTIEQISRLTYVAVTRARQQLFVPYCDKLGILS